MTFRIFGLLGLTTLLVSGETLTQGERDFALSSLHSTRKVFLDSLDGVSEAQWNFKAGPDRWSIAECAEHIVVTEELLTGLIHKSAAGKLKPEMRVPFAEARAKDEKIVAGTIDRSQKFQAPESIQPAKGFKSPEEVRAAFLKLRDANIEYVDTTKDDLRIVPLAHPAFGPIDAYQFLLLMSSHAQRHTLQILEVKAAPGYPSK